MRITAFQLALSWPASSVSRHCRHNSSPVSVALAAAYSGEPRPQGYLRLVPTERTCAIHAGAGGSCNGYRLARLHPPFPYSSTVRHRNSERFRETLEHPDCGIRRSDLVNYMTNVLNSSGRHLARIHTSRESIRSSTPPT